jgi:hypothetical protein
MRFMWHLLFLIRAITSIAPMPTRRAYSLPTGHLGKNCWQVNRLGSGAEEAEVGYVSETIQTTYLTGYHR